MKNNTANKKTHREFGLTSLSVNNSLSVVILAIMIILFGVNAFVEIPKEQFPEISMPTVYINTPYPGTSAKEIESLVSRPIEKELKSLNGVKKIESTSLQDFSVIIVEFETTVDIDEAVIDVKDAVDKAKSELPDDLPNEPSVLEVNFAELPIMSINMSGDFSPDELRNYAEYLQDEIEELKGVSKTEIKGSVDREMKIEVNLQEMAARKISFYDIQSAIQAENMTMSAGELLTNGFRTAVRVIGQYESADAIENTIIKSQRGNPIYLRDVARVRFDFEEVTSIARSDQLPVVSLDVVKRSGENLIALSDDIKKLTADAEAEVFPDKLKVQIFNDQSINTKNEISNLQNSIISGVILVVLVLLFFLGIRNAMFVGIAIPLSMLMGILILNLLGITMNMVVLFSLILALGLLVDNGIVVIENIYRYMQEGYSNIDAAKKGTGEVALPIIASTATTLMAFLPLAFWPGLMGDFMKYLPITLIVVLTSSLFVALVINPVLASLLMKIDERADDPRVRRRRILNGVYTFAAFAVLALIFHLLGFLPARNLLGIIAIITLTNVLILRPLSFVFQNKVLPVLERAYNSFIKFALKGIMPLLIFGGTFALLILAAILLGANQPKVEFFPSSDPLYVNAFVEMDMGTDIAETNELVADLEEKVEAVVAKYSSSGVVDAVLTQIGEGTADPSGPPEPGKTPNKARITVSFVPAQERNGVSTLDLLDEIRTALSGVAGVSVVVDRNQDGPVQGKPINLELRGKDLEKLLALSDDVKNYLVKSGVQGVEELKADVKLAKPEQSVIIDREKARLYGVSTRDIATAIRTSIYGLEISKFKQGEDEYPINIRANEDFRYDKGALINQKITFRDIGTGRVNQVPISTVAQVRRGETYTSIKRKDSERMVTLSSNTLEGYNDNEVVTELRTLMESYDMPRGFSWEFTGQQQEQAENTAFLVSALMIAVFGIFIILVSQFNSLSDPIIILITVLFSVIGVLLGYVFSNMDIFIIMFFVGIISLAGIVVNNAIVLIDYTKFLIKQKKEALGLVKGERLSNDQVRASIIEGGATRLRPVLLTAITTVLGLVPLAVGFNMNFFTLISDLDPNIFIGGDNVAFWGPLAWTVIYGLVFATFLTLVVVPVMYWIFYQVVVYFFKISHRIKSRFAIKEAPQS